MNADWIPGANLALGLAVLVYLIGFTSRRRNEMPREVMMLHVLAIVLLVGLLVTSAQQLADGDATALEAMQITAVKLVAAGILWRTRSTLYRTGTRHDGGRGRNADEDDPDREVSP